VKNQAELMYSLDQAYKVLQFNFELAKPPATPKLYSFAGNTEITLLLE